MKEKLLLGIPAAGFIALLVIGVLAGAAYLPVAYANTTTTTTTTSTSSGSSIDLSLIGTLIVQLLPVFVVLAVLKMLFSAFGRIAISKIHRFTNAVAARSKYIAAVAAVALLLLPAILPGAYAQTDGSVDWGSMIQPMIGLIISIMPLLLIIMIFKAIFGALSDAFK